MEDGSKKAIYVKVGNKIKNLSVPVGASNDEVKGLLRQLAGVGQHDVIKLFRTDGQLINPGTDLLTNTPSDPYEVYLAATTIEDTEISQVDLDLMDLETRLRRVEETVSVLRADLPPVVAELRRAVDTFRANMDTTQVSRLSEVTMGVCGVEDIPCPRSYRASSHPYWERVQYRRKVPEDVARVFAKFRQICDCVIAEETAQCLRLPTFNNWAWEDWEVLMLLQHMYQDLGLTKTFDIEIEVLRNFLCIVYLHYNQVPFHNFHHAFCVTQMMYGLICKCSALRERLSDVDIMVLITSCICHDLDHPGFNNIYQINARTELALRYNDISPLENHHCSIAFQIMERPQCNIFRNTSHEEYRRVREGIIRCILATDMARHNEILRDFKEVIPVFDFDNRAHVNLLFMILIKVADISNEARPLDIAEPWLECLLQEFFNQSDLEKMEGLPVSPFMDRDKVTKPTSQCSFIGFVLLPLFEALGEVLPELEDMIIKPVRYALDHYRRLKDMGKRPSEIRIEQLPHTPEDEEESQANSESEDHIISSTSLCASEKRRLSQENLKVGVVKNERSMSLKSSAASSKSSLAQRSFDAVSPVPDDTIDVLDGIPETEVDVMERTSRFKISTDAPISSSQKSSFERRPSYDGRASMESRTSLNSEDRLRDERKTNDNIGRDHPARMNRNRSRDINDSYPDRSNQRHKSLPNENGMRSIFAKSTKAAKMGCSFDSDSVKNNKSDNKWMTSSQSEQGHILIPSTVEPNPTENLNIETSNVDNRRFSVRSSNEAMKVYLKRGRSKSVADQPATNRTYSIAKSKINFKSSKNPCVKTKTYEPILLGTTSKLHPIVQSSITFNNKGKETVQLVTKNTDLQLSPSDEINENKFSSESKKFSLSLDMLPNRKNGRFKRSDQTRTSQHTPASSEDNLISIQSNPPSETSSPKTTKKRSESSRNLIFSLLKKSPTRKQDNQNQNSL